jgi:hypothetical protein
MKLMSNYLKNGTVLPSGLLSHNASGIMEGFKKTFQNKSLKAGIVTQSYAPTDPGNISKLFPEYDVLAFEQNEDKGSTVSIYRNCPLAASIGNIADYFEMTLRPLEKQTTKGTVPSPSGQDGSIVLLLCLNGMADTGIIVGALGHPDRPTNIVGTEPQLFGEYNGVAVAVNTDGSTNLTFKGATDSYGNPTNTSQGNTVVSIATDGSFQVQHSTITFTLSKSGDATLTTSGNTTIQCENANINCSEANIAATGTASIEGSSINLGANAAQAAILGNAFKVLYDNHTHSNGNGGSPTGVTLQPLGGSALSKKVSVE